MTENELEEWKKLTYKLGGVLMSAEKANTEEWMEYRDATITDANKKINELCTMGPDNKPQNDPNSILPPVDPKPVGKAPGTITMNPNHDRELIIAYFLMGIVLAAGIYLVTIEMGKPSLLAAVLTFVLSFGFGLYLIRRW